MATRTRKCRSAGIVDLAEAQLVSILQQVPLQQRLSKCALVCRAWAGHVGLTAADLELEFSATETSEQRQQQLQAWLSRCSEQLLTLQLQLKTRQAQQDSCARPELQLLCSNMARLEHLSVSNVTLLLHTAPAHVTTRSASNRSHPLSSDAAPQRALRSPNSNSDTAGLLPQLRHLELLCVDMSAQHFLQLSKLTGLSSLQIDTPILLKKLTPESTQLFPYPYQRHLCTALHTVLRGMSSLRELDLSCMSSCWDGDGDIAQALGALSSLRHLQRLTVDGQTCAEVVSLLPVLPTSLTALHLDGMTFASPDSYAGLQAATRLSSLRALHMQRSSLDPRVLRSCQQLQQLSISRLEVVSFAAADREEPTGSRPAMLLAALAQLPALQTLHLRGHNFQMDPAIDLQCFTALTASNELTELHLESSPLPGGALQQMFAADAELPQLRALVLEAPAIAIDPWESCRWVSGADIGSIGRCCSGLTRLGVRNVVTEGEDLHSLTALKRSLQHLTVEGPSWDDAAAAATAQLTALRRLQWQRNSDFTVDGLRHFTALRRLTELAVGHCQRLTECRSLMEVTQQSGNLELKEEAGQPEVWRQLQDLVVRRMQRGSQSKTVRMGSKGG